MRPSPTPAGGAARRREHRIDTPRSSLRSTAQPPPPRPSRRPGSDPIPTAQHGGGADEPRGYRISNPLRLRRNAFPESTDPSPRRPPGPVQVKPTLTTPPPPLPEEVVEEVLLRFPPDDPASLVRAALACRRWRRLICGPRFRRRFREFHRAPPMLGFFVNNHGDTSFFIRTSVTCPRLSINSTAVDARHGRVLLLSEPLSVPRRRHPLEKPFVVWDPITDRRRDLPLLPVVPGSFRPYSWNAAVLCAASLGGACDHLDCHRGPFLVVLVAGNNDGMISYVYSSEAGAWSEPTSAHNVYCSLNLVPTALVGSSLYFLNRFDRIILKYDLGTRQMSLIHLPENYYFGRVVLMTMEGGGLGFATVVNSTLYLWSWEAGRETDDGWAESGSIELMDLLPDGADPTLLYVIGCADSIGVVFLYSNVGTLIVDLKSKRVTKVWDSFLADMFSYVSFCTPAFGACTGEEPQVGISSA